MRFFITRHGQPAISENTQFPAGDPPLTELGRQQAKRLAERLKVIGFEGKVLSSPYARTAETADVICSVLDTTFFTEAIIREHTIPEAMAKLNGFTLEQLKKKFSHLDKNSKLEHPWWTINPPKKETNDEVTARVKPLLEKLAKGDEDILLVGHGASTVGCTRALLNMDWNTSKQSETPHPNWNCNLTIIETNPQIELLRFRDMAHLPNDMITSNKVTFFDYKNQLKA